MDDERLSDDERALLVMLDRDLQRELQIVPAPDFMARVRQNIAGTPIRVNSWRTWWAPATIAATVLIGVLGLLAQRHLMAPLTDMSAAGEVARVDPVPLPTPQMPPQATPPAPRASRLAPAESAALSPRVAQHPPTTRVARSAREPEVLVAPADERALMRFMALTNAGRIDSSSLDSIFASSADELVITPITVEPLPQLTPETDKPAGSGLPEPPPAVNALLTGLR